MWAGLGSQVDEDSVCRCEIVGFGEIRASTIGASEHDEWYNVSINYKDGEGLFTPYLHTKDLQVALYSGYLKARFNKLLPRLRLRYCAACVKNINAVKSNISRCYFIKPKS